MPNLWKNGKLIKLVDVRRVYKTCPRCEHKYAKFFTEGVITELGNTETYNCFTCEYCGRYWENEI